MKVFQGLQSISPPLMRSVLTIGNFDGVHRAHQQILAQAGLFAANTGGPVVVLTFEPHPLNVVSPAKAPKRLCLPEEKLRLLEASGSDVVVVAKSDPSLLGLEAEAFIREVIFDRFHPTHIVEGPTFGFGRGRKGTPELLSRFAAELGSEVHILQPITLQVDGEKMLISSSLIRKLLSRGKVRKASLCLGRPYAIIGEVVRGDRRGITIGFPTANVFVKDQLLPHDGVYAGRAIVGDQKHVCAISIGNAQTFAGIQRRLEAHLLDFDGDLYGQTIRVEFTRFLRPQKKFPSADALIEQLQGDVGKVRDGSPGLPTDTLFDKADGS